MLHMRANWSRIGGSPSPRRASKPTLAHTSDEAYLIAAVVLIAVCLSSRKTRSLIMKHFNIHADIIQVSLLLLPGGRDND